MVNVLPKTGVPYASVPVAGFDERAPIGLISLRVGGDDTGRPRGPLTPSSVRTFLGAARRAMVARLSGNWRRSAFFDAAGGPTKPATRLHWDAAAGHYRENGRTAGD